MLSLLAPCRLLDIFVAIRNSRYPHPAASGWAGASSHSQASGSPTVSLSPAGPHPAAPCSTRGQHQGGAGAPPGVGLALTGRSVAPWHVHTTRCSMLSCVLWWHRGTATLQVQDAPGSAMSLCPSVAPWHVHTACPGCSVLSRVPHWHRGTSAPCVWVPGGSVGHFSACPGRAPLSFQEQLPPRGQQGGRWHRASEGPRARAARHTGGGPAPCAGCRSQTVV